MLADAGWVHDPFKVGAHGKAFGLLSVIKAMRGSATHGAGSLTV